MTGSLGRISITGFRPRAADGKSGSRTGHNVRNKRALCREIMTRYEPDMGRIIGEYRRLGRERISLSVCFNMYNG